MLVDKYMCQLWLSWKTNESHIVYVVYFKWPGSLADPEILQCLIVLSVLLELSSALNIYIWWGFLKLAHIKAKKLNKMREIILKRNLKCRIVMVLLIYSVRYIPRRTQT